MIALDDYSKSRADSRRTKVRWLGGTGGMKGERRTNAKKTPAVQEGPPHMHTHTPVHKLWQKCEFCSPGERKGGCRVQPCTRSRFFKTEHAFIGFGSMSIFIVSLVKY